MPCNRAPGRAMRRERNAVYEGTSRAIEANPKLRVRPARLSRELLQILIDVLK